MRDLIRRQDLTTLSKGAAMAAVSGLLLGAAMQPELAHDGFIAPQIELPQAGARVILTASDPGVAAYGRNPPEYVIGTDYTRPHVMEEAVLAYDDRSVPEPVEASAAAQPILVYEAAAEARDVAARAAWRDAPAPAPHYPSVQGNTYYISDLPEPPAAPQEDAADALGA